MEIKTYNHKRFLVFFYYQYYPDGGLDDLDNTFDTIKETIEHIENEKKDFYDLYDRVEGQSINIRDYKKGLTIYNHADYEENI